MKKNTHSDISQNSGFGYLRRYSDGRSEDSAPRRPPFTDGDLRGNIPRRLERDSRKRERAKKKGRPKPPLDKAYGWEERQLPEAAASAAVERGATIQLPDQAARSFVKVCMLTTE